jgi:hypothetical protein
MLKINLMIYGLFYKYNYKYRKAFEMHSME